MTRSSDPTQTDPDVLQRAMTRTAVPNCTVIKSKLFHHNNLVLQLLFDQQLEIYTINVHRVNDGSDTDLWGLYNAAGSAAADGLLRVTRKFDAIRL